VNGSRAEREAGSNMNPYAILGSGIGTAEATALRTRLTTWHDAMVAHERRLKTGRTADTCDDECPHAEARTLWAEALATLGPRASELTFLRSRATAASHSSEEIVAARALDAAADRPTAEF
jgi:predicted phage gp36 major capsid-like protein